MRTRLRDLGLQLTPEGGFLVRAPGAGLAARVPLPAVELLAWCSTPRAREEAVARFGPLGGQLYDGLADVGLLVPPEDAAGTPVMFSNFAAVDVHRRMLADTPRLEAYAVAIRAVVRPGMAVLDAGSGSGILAGLACAAGARVVYAVDYSDMIDVTRETLERSGFGDRSVCIRADIATVRLPERVDVIVTETFGALALAEGGVEDVRECAAHNLAPGGVTIPDAVGLHLAPVVDPALLELAVGPFAGFGGVVLDGLRARALRRGLTTSIRPEQLGHPGVAFARVPLRDAGDAAGRVSLPAPASPVDVVGFAGWFTLHLAPGVTLDTGPHAPRTHWEQQLLPMEPVRWDAAWEVEVELAPAPEDRRGREVACRWSAGHTHHRVR